MEFIPMTPSDLQDALCEEIKKVLSDMIFTNPKGEEVEMQTFAQALPHRLESLETPAEDEEYTGEEDFQIGDPYPYTLVMIDTGKITEPIMIKMVLVIGIYDNDSKNQGHKRILNIIQKINERFTKNPTLKGVFCMSSDSFDFALPDDDTYPYFFGAVNMTWETAPYRREEDALA